MTMRASVMTLALLALAFASAVPLRADDEAPKADAKADEKPAGIAWETDFEAALARAKDAGKPVVVYLRADYCLFCKKMEKKVWTDAKVLAAAKRFVAIKVDLTRLSPQVATVQNRVKAPGRTPWLAFFSTKGALLDSKRLGFEDEEIEPEELAKILDKIE